MGNQNFRTLRGGQSKLQKEKIPVQYHQHLKQAPNHLFISIDSTLSQILKCGVMMMMKSVVCRVLPLYKFCKCVATACRTEDRTTSDKYAAFYKNLYCTYTPNI